MQKHVNLVDLVKSFPTNMFLQNLASIQKRTSPIKFAHSAEKSEKGSISNLSTKVATARPGSRRGAAQDTPGRHLQNVCEFLGGPFSAVSKMNFPGTSEGLWPYADSPETPLKIKTVKPTFALFYSLCSRSIRFAPTADFSIWDSNFFTAPNSTFLLRF